MAEPGLQAQGIPAPNPLPLPADQPEPQAPQQPAQPAQQVIHLNWSHFSTRFFRKNLMGMQKPIFFTLMTG